jgi:NADP-dependent 3-hydroxy acid dehydrogenase YdfG
LKERFGMLLENENAVVYGAGGSIGGAVARAFSREGAKVFLAGRTRESLEAVAMERTGVIESPHTTHLRFRILKED